METRLPKASAFAHLFTWSLSSQLQCLPVEMTGQTSGSGKGAQLLARTAQLLYVRYQNTQLCFSVKLSPHVLTLLASRRAGDSTGLEQQFSCT